MKTRIFLTTLLAVSSVVFASDIYDDISSAIRSGDARQLSAHFGQQVDLALHNREDVYSKAQAEQLLRDFFTKNPPKSFTLVHKGSSKEGTLFAVGTFVSSNGKTFRASFVLKMAQNKYLLQELRFESQ